MKSYPPRSSKSHVIIIGIDHYLGLQSARIFHERGVPVIGIARDRDHYACKTNVCERIIYSEILDESLIPTLLKLAETLSEKAALVPCRDASVLALSRNRKKLAKHFLMAMPAPETVEMLMDKHRFYEYAQKHDLPIPAFRMIYNDADARAAAKTLRFPCIFKPTMKTPDWEINTKHKAFKVTSAEELLDLYRHYGKWAICMMAQEWIEGDDHHNYSCNAYFNENSEAEVTFTAKKLRQWPPRTGNSSLGVECRNDEVLNTALHLFKLTRFRGLAYLEMKRDKPSGKYFIIEPNICRPTGRSAIAEAGGVELLYTMYCHLTGKPLPEPAKRTQAYTGVKWIYLRQDLQSAFQYWRNGELTLLQWAKSLRGKKSFAVFSLRDPLPFLEDVRARTIANLFPGLKNVVRKLLNKWQKAAQSQEKTEVLPYKAASGK